MVQDPVVKPFFASVFPGLVFCSVSVQRPTIPMHPHSHPRNPWGPSAIVIGGTHTAGKFWVAPGSVLATPFKQQGIPTSKMVGGGVRTGPCICCPRQTTMFQCAGPAWPNAMGRRKAGGGGVFWCFGGEPVAG